MKSRPKNQQLPVRRIPVHELFPQPDALRPRTNPTPAPAAKVKRSVPRVSGRNLPIRNFAWALVFLGLILTGFGLFGYYRRGESQAPYVLLEVRALEESGHPVTAADVIVNEKKMGVTDSFGEWRRYLQLQPGDEVKVDLLKKGKTLLSGSKVAEVPGRNSAKQDIELQVAITLKNPKDLSQAPVKEKPALKSKSTAAAAAVEPENFDGEVSDAAGIAPSAAHMSRAEVAADDSADSDNSLGIYFDDGLNRISVLSSVNQAKPANLMDKRQQDVVRERIVPVLVNDLQNLGLNVDKAAPWKIALSYVPNGEQVGYIRAEIEWRSPFGQTEKSSFIAGFAKTYDETGRALSSLLRLHMKKTYWAFKENGNWFIDETAQTKDFWRLKAGSVVTDTAGEKFPIAMAATVEGGGRRWKMKIGRTQPCEGVRQRSRCMVSTESLKEAPPLVGWSLKRVRILGNVPSNADVYVAGFQAHAVGNGQWEFWSHSGSNLKALILAGGRIVHSEAFVDHPGEAIVLKMAGNPSKANLR